MSLTSVTMKVTVKGPYAEDRVREVVDLFLKGQRYGRLLLGEGTQEEQSVRVVVEEMAVTP